MADRREQHEYRVAAWWTSGLSGIAKTDTAPNAITFTAPEAFGGFEGSWTPEDLLLAAVAACYTTTVRTIATGAQSDFTDLEVEASGTIRKQDSGYGFTEIVLRPVLKIADSDQMDRAVEFLKKAERLCLVSRALNIPVRFEPQLEVLPPASPNATLPNSASAEVNFDPEETL
jgi:organic hydroperoxide reductase OsmC/OhrA